MRNRKARTFPMIALLALALLLPLSGCKTLARAEGDSGGLYSWGVGIRF